MLTDAEIAEFVNRPRPIAWYDRHYRELRDAIYAVMCHGVRYDLEMARAKRIELESRKVELKAELLTTTNGVKLWSEKSHNSPELLSLREQVKELKARYDSIPKSDRGARKAFKPQIDAKREEIVQLRAAGGDKVIEVGTGLSDDKICEYLYTTLGIAPIRKRRKDSNKVTVTADDIALKKIRLRYPQHTNLIRLVLEHRKANKLMGYLNEAMIDRDGRIRTMYKPFGTQSGRLSSSENPLGTGTNLQNFDRSLKTLLLPDPD